MNAKLWRRLNSPIVVWFIGTVLVGLAVWLFEGYTDGRDRSRLLRERFDRLGFEYAGRLSQYSEWFIYLLEDPDNLVTPKFKQCVNPSMLKTSIKKLGGSPSSGAIEQYASPNPCEVSFSYAAIFPEFKDHSTVSVLAEMMLIHDEMQLEGDGRPVKVPVHGCKYDQGVVTFSDRLVVAINDFLNPDAVVPLSVKSLDSYSVEDFRKSAMCSFYGIGPEKLWYADALAG